LKWKYVRLWRFWLTLGLGLVLFALAALQATDHHLADHRAQVIGVATKAITGIIAILVIRIVQDVMDKIDGVQRRLDQLDPPKPPDPQ
jgi:hypothetical protein